MIANSTRRAINSPGLRPLCAWPLCTLQVSYPATAYNALMKVVIAPQAFKGGLRGIEAARAMEVGVRRVYPDAHTVLVPVADGGDGTLEALVGDPDEGGPNGQASGGRYFWTRVTGPLGYPVEAVWGVMPDGHTAVVELARASGLALVPEGRQDPRNATTYGTGELVRAALDSGYRQIIVGLGEAPPTTAVWE